MVNILLVEDEQIVRVAMKALMDWSAHGFCIAYEARHGKQALEIIAEQKDIDIVMTDINMPVMDGITLIEHIVRLPISPKIIVLSAYDDYKLVRQAFRLGIYDYILKTEMVPDQVLKLLQSVVMDRKKDEPSARTYTLYDKSIFLKGLIDNQIMGNIHEKVKSYELRLTPCHLMVCYIWIDNYATIMERYQNNSIKAFSHSVLEIIHEVLEHVGVGEVMLIDADAYGVLISHQSNSRLEQHEQVDEILKKIRHRLLRYMNVEISVGISTLGTDYEALSRLYEEAKHHAKRRYILGKGKNIYPDDMHCMMDESRYNVLESKAPLLMAIREHNKDTLLREMDKLFQLINSYTSKTIEEIQSIYIEIIYMIIYTLKEEIHEDHNIFEHNTNFYSMIRNFDTQAEMSNWMKNLVGNMMDYLLNHDNNRGNSTILRAYAYMEKHYMKKLTLYQVSSYLELSEGYLSKLFTQETGKSFVRHLTDLRIHKAKGLLTGTNMKVYEICEAVGYENVEHFSRVFKKIVGSSPKQYKRSGNVIDENISKNVQ